MTKRQGWFNNSYGHSMASMGIKTTNFELIAKGRDFRLKKEDLHPLIQKYLIVGDYLIIESNELGYDENDGYHKLYQDWKRGKITQQQYDDWNNIIGLYWDELLNTPNHKYKLGDELKLGYKVGRVKSIKHKIGSEEPLYKIENDTEYRYASVFDGKVKVYE